MKRGMSTFVPVYLHGESRRHVSNPEALQGIMRNPNGVKNIIPYNRWHIEQINTHNLNCKKTPQTKQISIA